MPQLGSACSLSSELSRSDTGTRPSLVLWHTSLPPRLPTLREGTDATSWRARGVPVDDWWSTGPEVLDARPGRVYTDDMTTPTWRLELEPEQLAQAVCVALCLALAAVLLVLAGITRTSL